MTAIRKRKPVPRPNRLRTARTEEQTAREREKRRRASAGPSPDAYTWGGPVLPPGARCAGRSPLWDAHVPGETAQERTARLSYAVDECAVCCVRAECTAALADERVASGVWAGVLVNVDRGAGK